MLVPEERKPLMLTKWLDKMEMLNGVQDGREPLSKATIESVCLHSTFISTPRSRRHHVSNVLYREDCEAR